jgi:hypothetical protein
VCFAESYGHTTDFNLIHDVVLPLLRERGLGEADFDRLLVQNPRHLFTGVSDAVSSVVRSSVTLSWRKNQGVE